MPKIVRPQQNDRLLSLIHHMKDIGIRNSFYFFYSSIIILALIVGYFFSYFEYLPFDPEDLNLDYILSPPLTDGHLLGTDYLGRDTFSRLILGIEAYLAPSILAVIIAIFFGTLMGIASIFSHKRVTRTLSMVNDSLLAMPKLVLLFLIIAIFDPTIFYIMIVIGISNIPSVAQLLTAKIDLLKERSFIDSAIASGISYHSIILKHILWSNCRVILFSQSAFIMGEAILMEASLSYLGFGVQEPTPSWGNMVQSSSNYLLQGDLWSSTIPAFAIMLVISAFYLLSYTISRVLEKGK